MEALQIVRAKSRRGNAEASVTPALPLAARRAQGWVKVGGKQAFPHGLFPNNRSSSGIRRQSRFGVLPSKDFDATLAPALTSGRPRRILALVDLRTLRQK